MVYYKCRKKTQAVIFSSYISPLFEKNSAEPPV